MTSDNTTAYDLAYNDAMNDPRADIETINTSRTGIVITTVSASASLLGSAIIIFLILRYSAGLKTVYHRIIFGMSVYDILQSIPIALTTLPMPKDMIYKQFDGIIIGNTTSCSIQGVAFTMGAVGAAIYNAILCIYYICSIRFGMKDEIFRRCLEPWLHLCAISLSLFLVIFAWHYQQINPSPVQFTWCAYTRYPYWCGEDDEECSYERGQPEVALILPIVVTASIIIIAATVVISMIMIIRCVYSRERLLKAYMGANDAISRGNQRRLSAYRSDVQYTKAVVFQALMYTLVFFAVWHYPLLNAVIDRDRGAPYESNQAKEIALLVFRPLQGFFNTIIFIHHKVRKVRRHHRGLSLYEALKMVFERREEDPEHIVSNLTLVKRDAALVGLRFAFEESPSDNDDDDDDEDSAHDRGRLSLKKYCVPEAIEMSGSLEGGRAIILSPDESVGVSTQDLEGFCQGLLSIGQVSVAIDDDTTTPFNRSEYSIIRNTYGLDNPGLVSAKENKCDGPKQE